MLDYGYYYYRKQPLPMKKPRSYYCHRTQSSTDSLPKGYQIIDKIGEGAFGQVYKVFNTQTSSIEVIKKNKDETSDSLMHRESEILKQLQNSDGFAKIKGKDRTSGCLVMTLLGENLQDIIDRSSLTIIDMKRIAYQCVARLRELHERGFVHRDLKPENILMGNQNSPHKIYIVDFGLSNTYKSTAATARTIKFCPLASHYGYEQYPKDDLESLGYLLAYVATKKLPWSGLPKDLEQDDRYRMIKMKKEAADVDALSQGIGCLKKYFRVVKGLKVGTSIDYNSLLEFFRIECKEIYCYSFCKEKCFDRMKESTQNQISQEGKVEPKATHYSSIINKHKSRDEYPSKQGTT